MSLCKNGCHSSNFCKFDVLHRFQILYSRNVSTHRSVSPPAHAAVAAPDLSDPTREVNKTGRGTPSLSRNGIGSKLEWKREEGEGIEAGGESGGSLFRKGEGKGRGLFAKASSVRSVKQFANSKTPREKFDSYNVAVIDFVVFVIVRDSTTEWLKMDEFCAILAKRFFMEEVFFCRFC